MEVKMTYPGIKIGMIPKSLILSCGIAYDKDRKQLAGNMTCDAIKIALDDGSKANGYLTFYPGKPAFVWYSIVPGTWTQVPYSKQAVRECDREPIYQRVLIAAVVDLEIESTEPQDVYEMSEAKEYIRHLLEYQGDKVVAVSSTPVKGNSEDLAKTIEL